MKKAIKTPKQLERHLKGVTNHRRIEILSLVAESKGVSLEDIAESLDCNIKTISEHARRLAHSGLVRKEYQGRRVIHTLSPYGRIFYKFLQTFSHS